MSKTIDVNDLSNSELIPENLLYEIFEVQYDDLFCKILKISEKSFTYFLHQQVIFNLLIIKKKVEPSILTAFQELFNKRYKENFKMVKKNYEIIKDKEKKNSDDLAYLDVTKCFIHCHKCYNILHKCGTKLVLYDEHIYCTKCNNVYNKNQIMLFCPECKKNYFTKLRKPIFNNNKKFEKLFILKYKKYHCPSGKEEKIKCIKCSNNLYFRLIQNNPNNEDNINTIYCIKCKLKYNLKEVLFKCKICLNNFKCQARIYRDFPSKKKKLLFLIHTLLRNKNALPNYSLCDKKCTCDIKDISEYNHTDDGGKFLEGIKNNKKTVVCDKCYKIFEYNQIKWNCPTCLNNFEYKIVKDIRSKTKSKSKSKTKTLKKTSNKELLEKSNNLNFKKISLYNININNINNIYKKGFYFNDYILKSQENIYNSNTNSKFNKKSNIIYGKTNYEKFRSIFSNNNESIKRKNKRSYLIVKSKSKNDLIKNRNNYYHRNLFHKKNSNMDINAQDKEKKNINVINSSEKLEKEEKNIEKELKKEEKEEKEKGERGKNEEKDSKKENKEEIVLNEKNEIKKSDKKELDTRSIFNNIKNNIFNFDELYPEMLPKIDKRRKIRASGRNIIGNTFFDYNDDIEENKNMPIMPKIKNSYVFNKKELFYGDFYDLNNFNEKVKNGNGELIDNNMNMNTKANSQMESIDNYEYLPTEKKNKKMNINYAKKIYFFNGKTDNDCRSLDQKVNINLNKYYANDLYKKDMNNMDLDNIEMSDNNYINNSQYIYGNDNNYSIANYDNYYYNFQNYEDNSQQFNLYNFNSENYSKIGILGQGSSGKIYLVKDLNSNQRFALKSMLIDNEEELKRREEQYNLIYKMTYEHPELKIINIYGLELRRFDEYNMFLNVLMEKGHYDWETEILNRKKSKSYYTEQELFYILSNLVGTFAFLQQKGISHRDVKPQNILCFGKNIYKICDFGEAKYQNKKKEKKNGNNKNLDISNQTIRGTEMYMSPILFNAIKLKPDSLTKYNSFKSDVFSLGLCFLHASSLDIEILYKVREYIDMKKIQNLVNQYLGDKYSQDFINILLYMLQVDENYRPDFIELNSWLLYGNYY